jgi:hypothetical protein
MKIVSKIIKHFKLFATLDKKMENIQCALARIETRQVAELKSATINQLEFKAFSQWGEDGIIQYLINSIAIQNQVFIEFGVETYIESNTRFLLVNNNWSGLVLDGSQSNIEYIKSDSIYWRYNLKADCAFINSSNINGLISRNGLSGDIGLLSVDIDGNDYWVWKAIDVVNPSIVVCEYNSLWGFRDAVTTPYDPGFVRSKKHYSNLYYGASIKALNNLASSKGYTLVAGNLAGNNVFFVKNELLGSLKALSVEEAWVQSQFRESRNQTGQLTYLDYHQRRSLLADLPLVDIDNDQTIKVSDLR